MADQAECGGQHRGLKPGRNERESNRQRRSLAGGVQRLESASPPQLAQYTLNPVPGFFQCVGVFNKTSERQNLLLEQARPTQLLGLLIRAQRQDMFEIGAAQDATQEAFAKKRLVVVQGTGCPQ